MNRTERELLDSLFGAVALLAQYQNKEIFTRTVPELALQALSHGDYTDYATKHKASLETELQTIRSLNGLSTDGGRSAYVGIQRCIAELEAFVEEVN